MIKRFFFFAVLIAIVLIAFAKADVFGTTSSTFSSVTYQQAPIYSSSDISTYWPALNQQNCQQQQDILLQTVPGSCQPAVVRSDLLAQQDVPVFCEVSAIQVNPLINIKAIDSMTFSGTYSDEVGGTGFHPAQAALSSSSAVLNNPTLNNIGYIVVLLKRQANESALPDSVSLNLTAHIEYNAFNALGIGNAQFVLPEQSDAEWAANLSAHAAQSFWQGRYYVQVESATSSSAVVSLYYGSQKIGTVQVPLGKISSDIAVPGFSSCSAALQVAYDGFQADQDRAVLQITSPSGTDIFDAYNSGSGTSFYNSQCNVQSLGVTSTYAGTINLVCGTQHVLLSLGSLGSGTSQPSGTAASVSQSSVPTLQNNKYYIASLGNYQSVAQTFPTETQPSSTTTYGEDALSRAITLARSNNDIPSLQQLLTLFIQQYPNSALVPKYQQNLGDLKSVDFSHSTATLLINNQPVTIQLIQFQKASAQQSVTVSTSGAVQSQSYLAGASINLGTNGNVVVKQISPDSVTFTPNCNVKSGSTTSTTTIFNNGDITLTEGQSYTACGLSFTLNKINAAKLAQIRIIPDVHLTGTDTNLSLQIGIEKRAIQLSPDKTKQMILNLNQSIQKWESISNTLGKVVTDLKAACFATATVLTVENFISGADGTSMARQKMMTGANGWDKKCADAIASKVPIVAGQTYVSVDDCLRQNADQINSDVAKEATILENQNKLATVRDQPFVTSNTLFGTSINTDQSAIATLKYIQSTFGGSTISIPLANQQSETIGSFANKIYTSDTNNAWTQGAMSVTDMQSFELYANVLQTSGVSDVATSQAQKALAGIISATESKLNLYTQSQATIAMSKNTPYGTPIDTYSPPKSNKLTGNYYGELYESGSLDFKSNNVLTDDSSLVGKPFERIREGSNEYAVFLQKVGSSTDTYSVDSANVYVLGSIPSSGIQSVSAKATTQQINDINSVISQFKFTNSASCSNKYINYQVIYFETDPYKGMPHIVPVDTSGGWYAGVQQILPTTLSSATSSTGTSAYQSSGRVESFWLCNVGPNGIADFDQTGFGDDNCQQFNLNTGQSTNYFSCLGQSQTQSLVQKAISALTQAAQQHTDGLRVASINGQPIPVGTPASNTPTAQCQDYMSPRECQLLFNVCDPVICPSSRCDLGGKYTVPDVASTGIIGSTLLCLPNAREGIYIPVCLTGIKSGIDNFVSLLENHRDCLQEQLDTGQTVGICDQIYSVYACQLFWQQVAPIMNVLLPKLVESAYGQGTHGGGEYLTVMAAWQNTQNSVNYFTQQYAVNSFNAFKLRSLSQTSDEFCKAYASITSPSSLKTLVEPDSPPQFNAWFSSVPFTDATVPATSQYKVFYHIYSGKDTGTYYDVYLKNPPTTAYYSYASTVEVASGYINAGNYASDTKDFTAPQGYQQLCVRINDQEQCGFNQVSTSFAVNYATDSVVSNELTTTNITSSTSCVSGDPSVSAVLSQAASGNLQNAAQSAINPQIYNQGIIRICATNDPGASSAPGRFVRVGYCDSQNIGCWLDTNSVSNAISQYNTGVKNATISQLTTIANQALNAQGFITDLATAQTAMQKIQTEITNLALDSTQSQSLVEYNANNIISEISTLQQQLYLNNNKAEALFLLGLINDKVANFELTLPKTSSNNGNTGVTPTTTPASSVQASSVASSVSAGNFLSLSSSDQAFLDSYVKANSASGSLEVVSGSYNSALFGLNRAAFYLALNYYSLPVYVLDNPATTLSSSLPVYYTTSWSSSNTIVGSINKNLKDNTWLLTLNSDPTSTSLLGSIYLLNNKVIGNPTPVSTSAATSAVTTTTSAASPAPTYSGAPQTLQGFLGNYLGAPQAGMTLTINRPSAFDVSYSYDGQNWQPTGLASGTSLPNLQFIQQLLKEKSSNQDTSFTITTSDNGVVNINSAISSAANNYQISKINLLTQDSSGLFSYAINNNIPSGGTIFLQVDSQCDVTEATITSSTGSRVTDRMLSGGYDKIEKLSSGSYNLLVQCYSADSPTPQSSSSVSFSVSGS